MSVFEESAVLRLVKRILQHTVLRPGTTARIIRGPLRGYRYVISSETGWAPLYGGWEPGAAAVYKRLVQRGDIVFDIGANTGIHSLLFSKLVGPKGHVVAFEPLPENVAILKHVLGLNRVVNVRVERLAIAATTGEMRFKRGKDAKQGSLIGTGLETGEELEVYVQTLDNLIDTGAPAPNFVKVDVEGAESAVLAGFTKNIGRTNPTFAVDLHTPAQDVRVGAFFNQHGYNLFRVRDATSAGKADQRELLVPIPRWDVGWPNPDGVWGTVVAIHSDRVARLSTELQK
jgi:FkbM family methyltransferase